MIKTRAPQNRTLTLNAEEKASLEKRLISTESLARGENFIDKTINADIYDVLPLLPDRVFDLIIIDPPYNLTKNFNGSVFNATSEEKYESYIDSWLGAICKKLKDSGSLYMCGDWKCTSAMQRSLSKYLVVINRITWQREKGRGSLRNWKNSMEDIWFAVKDKNNYYFDVEAVKQKRRVIAPYRINGKPKDWEENSEGQFRLTYPSNFWDDISVPFWSMSENTDHPTQKSEKLYAKLVLASCPPGGAVLDPFLGSGTASVAAKKLGRHYCGVEINKEYCLWAEKRLSLCKKGDEIQGLRGGVFWERNSLSEQKKSDCKKPAKRGTVLNDSAKTENTACSDAENYCFKSRKARAHGVRGIAECLQ